MKICMIGTGYVGLVSGVCFAETGNNVICVDIDETKINNLKNGIIPIYEPGLSDLLERNYKESRLHFTTDLKAAVEKSDILFIAVGTPPDEDGSADLKHVLTVAREIGEYMNDYKVVIVKSTVPVGTCYKVKEAVSKIARHKFDVVSNPEFLKEGAAVDDCMRPERVICGVESEKAGNTMRKLYEPFVKNENPILIMDIKSSEMSKYASNAFLATKISFINEIANLCDYVGADIRQVRRGMTTDSRIGKKFLYPGVGYGGSCFPKDVQAIVKIGEEHNFDMKVMKSVEEVNNEQKRIASQKVIRYFKNDLNGKTIGIWGLSFKPRTDDMREAPSIVIINELLEKGAKVKAFDPIAMDEAKKIFGDKIEYSKTSYNAIDSADALVLVTEWNEFRLPDFNRMKELMNNPVVFDGRNQYDPEHMRNLGFEYFSIGLHFLTD